MPQPVLLIVDGASETRDKLQESVKDKYGEAVRVMVKDSAADALEALRELKDRGELVVLLLVSQEMPGMNGIAFLEEAVALYPDAKRILFTADAATEDITDGVSVDAYLSQPWHEPEVCLHPVLDDLLADEQKTPVPKEIHVLCQRWSSRAHEIRDLLARYQIPFQFLDVTEDEQARRLAARVRSAERDFPLVLFPDGAYLAQPTDEEIAQQIGYSTQAQVEFYDLVIVGGGPAGLAAAIYAASEGLSTLVIEREAPGGQAGLSSKIENYPGFPEGLSGGELAKRTVEQARGFGAELLVTKTVTGLRTEDPYRVVTLEDGTDLRCYAVLLASGMDYRKLDAPGADRLTNSGVYYGATRAEAYAYRDQRVCIVGGGNSAGQAAMQLSRYARTVTILTLEGSLTDSMSQYLAERLEVTENITVRPHATATEVKGEERVEAVTVKDTETNEEETVPTDGVFVFIGGKPHSDWLDGIIGRDESGFILTGSDLGEEHLRHWPLDRDPLLLETSMPGVFAVGDVRHGSVKRVTSAVGEGSMVLPYIHQYLNEVEQPFINPKKQPGRAREAKAESQGDTISNELTQRFIDALHDVENRQSPDVIVKLFRDDATLRRMPQREAHEGRDGAQQFWREYLNDFKRISTTFHDVVDAGEHIILEWQSEGELADGQTIQYNGLTILVASGEQIRALRTYYDSAVFVPGGATHDRGLGGGNQTPHGEPRREPSQEKEQ